MPKDSLSEDSSSESVAPPMSKEMLERQVSIMHWFVIIVHSTEVSLDDLSMGWSQI